MTHRDDRLLRREDVVVVVAYETEHDHFLGMPMTLPKVVAADDVWNPYERVRAQLDEKRVIAAELMQVAMQAVHPDFVRATPVRVTLLL